MQGGHPFIFNLYSNQPPPSRQYNFNLDTHPKMSSSPYISQNLRNYLNTFKLEQLINTCVNQIAKEMPQDPYSYIVNTFQKNASLDIKFLSIAAVEVFNADMVPVLSIQAEVDFMGKSVKVVLGPVGIANDQSVYLYDEDRMGGKGLNKGIQFVEELNSVISNKVCSQQEDIDKALLAAYETKGNKGLYQVNICSYLPSLITSRLLHQPVHTVFSQLFNAPEPKMRVCINCLQGSKLVNSKCKAFKFMLICDDLVDPSSITNVIQSIRKAIVSGKGGEAALKYSPDGTFICPADTIIDNLKIVDEAIAANAGNSKDKISVGISWMSDNFYNPDQKKYELENPKALLDLDQLIEYYFKLATDRPSITYMEDGVFSEDVLGWNRWVKKFEGSRVRIGSRKVLPTLQSARNNLLVAKEEKPELSESEINGLNDKNFRLQMHWYRPFQLVTLSNLVSLFKELQKSKTLLILSQNLVETTDTTLVDLCYSTGSYLNLSSPLKFNQISKLNRISEILKYKV